MIFILVGLLIALKLFSFWIPPNFFFPLFKVFDFSRDAKNSGQFDTSFGGTLKGRDPNAITNSDLGVSKTIKAKDGGSLKVKTKSGLYATLMIPPGSLKEDTTITMSPNEEDPLEGVDPDPQDPGVVVGPIGTNFTPPAVLVFSYIPGPPGTENDADPASGAQTPDEQDWNFNVPGISKPSPVNEPENEQSGSRRSSEKFPKTTVIVYVDDHQRGGGVPTRPTVDGAGVWGSIGGSGAAAPQEPNTEGAQELVRDAEQAASGSCSGAYLEALARMVAVASAEGNETAVSRYESEMRRCNDQSLDYLEGLCNSDPIRLRRADFENRLELAKALAASGQTASEIERLMNECQARYHFYGEGIHPQSSNGITMFSSLDASVCGYIDDKWNGIQIYRLDTDVQGTSYVFEGTNEFSLPPNGGPFSATTQGSNTLNVVGVGVATPQFDFGFTGYFDGNLTIQTLNLSPGTIINGTPIELIEKPCVPLAPLPGGSN